MNDSPKNHTLHDDFMEVEQASEHLSSDTLERTRTWLHTPRLMLKFFRKHFWKTILAIIVIVGVTWLIIFLRSEEKPEYITATSERGDIVQVVEAVGTITSEKDLELKFPVSGLVATVYVTEGDLVQSGQILAELRNTIVLADLAAADAALRTAQAELRALQEGTRPEDIAITEAEVSNKRAALATAQSNLVNAEAELERSQNKLENLLKESDTSLEGFVATSRSKVLNQIDTALTSLYVVIGVLEDSQVQDAIIKSDPAKTGLIRGQLDRVQGEISSLLSREKKTNTHNEVLQLLRESHSVIASAAVVVSNTYNTILSLPLTAYFDSDEREAQKSTLSDERSTLQSAISTIDSVIKDLNDEQASYETQIASEEKSVTIARGDRDSAITQVKEYETAIRIQEAQLGLKVAGTRAADLEAAEAKVQKLKAERDRKQGEYEETLLTAPIDGTITKVSLKPGEFTPGQFSETDAAMNMLGASPYRVEMYVAEIDIPKVYLSQSGSIELDAFPGAPYELAVNEIDPAATDVDGVSKYLVTLDFEEQNPQFKIGMTGDGEIYTGHRENVITIPARAVIEDEDGDEAVRILQDDGSIEVRKIETGLEGLNDIEIVDGIKKGETIIVLVK